MKKKFKEWLMLFPLIGIIFLFTLLACSPVIPSLLAEDSYEYAVSENLRYYTINTDTILTSLAQEQTNVFFLKVATPEAKLIKPDKVIEWKQADYLQIAQTFHEFIKQEPAEIWMLHRMRFDAKCENSIQDSTEKTIGQSQSKLTLLKRGEI